MIKICIIATILSAILYRLGGSAKDGSWYDWMKWSKTRDWGCTIVALVALGMMGRTLRWYWYIPTFIGCWLALTTYWDDIFNTDSYVMHLLFVGLSFLLFAIVHGCWVGFILRAVVMAFFGWASHLIDETELEHRDVVSELVRGASIILTLPLMFI